jgi:hypothetical protein
MSSVLIGPYVFSIIPQDNLNQFIGKCVSILEDRYPEFDIMFNEPGVCHQSGYIQKRLIVTLNKNRKIVSVKQG